MLLPPTVGVVHSERGSRRVPLWRLCARVRDL